MGDVNETHCPERTDIPLLVCGSPTYMPSGRLYSSHCMMCVPCCTSGDLLHATFILGHGQSDGSGVIENRVDWIMSGGKKKAAAARSDGINEETGQVV